MQNLYLADEYIIKNEIEISNTDLKVLSKLYLPLIGKNAFSFYLALIGESDIFNVFTTNFKISRLALISDLTIEQIKEAVNTLEGIGLLKTYVKYQDYNEYLFEIHRPVSPKKFFANSIYNVLLYRKLKKDEYDRTKYMFLSKEINLKEYEEITATFEQAFFFNYNSTEGTEAFSTSSIRDNQILEIESNYNLDVFYQELSQLQIRKDTFTKQNLVCISQLGMIYSIDGIQLAGLVVESLEDGHLNEELLKVKAENYYSLEPNRKLEAIYRKQPFEYRNQEHGNDQRAKKIEQLETLSPYEYIQAKQQSTPQRSDLEIVEKCMMDIGLTSGVVNVLLDYTWAVNNGNMPSRFMEKVAASWKRKNIKTVEQAMEEAKKALKAKKSVKNIEKVNVEVKQVEQKEVDDDLLKKLLAEVGE